MNKKILLVMLLGIFMLGLGSAALTDNIESYYKLDETSGVVLDSLLINNGTNNGATRGVTGIIDNAFDFESSNSDNVNLNSARLPTGTNADFSISAWVNVESHTVERMVVAQKQEAEAGRFSISIDSTGKLKSFLGGSSSVTLLGTTTIPTGHWSFVTATRNSGTIKIYLNGSEEDSATSTQAISGTNTRIGSTNLPVDFFDGKIDEVGIWDRALILTEIEELYNNGIGLTYPFGPVNSNPNITLLTPTNNSKQTASIINFTANITVSAGFNHSNQTLYIWNENGSLFYTNTSTKNYNLSIVAEWSHDDFELGTDYIWNVFACGNDSICNWDDNNFTFTASAFSEYAVTFETSVLETDNKQFNLTINSTGVDEVSSTFWYNGSSYPALTTNLGNGNYKAISNIDIPLQDSTGNKSFFWQFDFILTNQNSLQQNSTVYSQEVNRTFFQFCNATYNIPFVNFTTRDAENPFPTQVSSFKSAWEFYVTTGTGTVFRNLSYEDVNENVSNFQFCASPNVTFNINADLEIDADGYAQNYHYLVNSQISNDTSNINLYLLNDSLATPTTLQVKDKFQNPVEGILIHIQLYDVGTDTFYTVGMSRTNNNGEDNAYLNWYDSLYKFILIQNEEIILSTNITKVFETPKKFTTPDVTTYSFDKFRDFQYSLTFDDITKIFQLTFVKPSGDVEQGCLRVIKRTSIEDTQVCLTCSSSTSATVFCDVSTAGNGTFIAAFYATGSWFMIDWVDTIIGKTFAQGINDLLDQDDAAFYTILLIGIVLSMFLFNAVLGIIGILLGLLAAGALGFTVLTYSLYLGIVIIGGVIIWILKK